MEIRRKIPREGERGDDAPIYSRLFVVCYRNLKENCIRDAFSSFGEIEDIRIPYDYNTGEPKGVVFIKFSKTSEAAHALEAMHNKAIENFGRPLKVLVATNRTEIQSDDNNTDKYRRLFINVQREVDEKSLNSHFKQFGNVEDILIQRDRNTGEGKGFAYIKFSKFSEAATAFEECDKKYRAIFAQPKRHNRRAETSFEANINTLALTSTYQKTALMSMMNVNPRGFKCVDFICSPYLTLTHIERLFDIIPGMTNCRYSIDLGNNLGQGSVEYSNPISAEYSIQKLNDFEYPPGQKIFVKPANFRFNFQHESFNLIPNTVNNLRNAIANTCNSSTPDLAQLAEAIAEASRLIKMATTGVSDDNIPNSNDLNYCSVKLPHPQPLADIDSPVAKRCFLICKPQPPPLTVLRDIFCRYGNLINVYTLPNRTIGYARYSVAESADEAINNLHGAEICGIRMKVLEAEDEVPAKRMKLDY